MVETAVRPHIPRIPLEGKIDLTYRCNNSCLHCWVSLPVDSDCGKDELSTDAIRRLVDDARAMGCRRWSISGGEPILRPDFMEIFDYITRKSIGYTINTNGTLITPEIAQLFTRKGTKMIALYGATAEVYDQVTRHPGGFAKVMEGFENLRQAGAGFIVQLIPMQANWHQWDEMVALAKHLSPHWRVGAPWIYMSAIGSEERNHEIAAQRLKPCEVVAVDKPDPTYRERKEAMESICGAVDPGDDRLFARCIDGKREFHVDPYGGLSWCSMINDPALRYDLKNGTFAEAWNTFIPSCAEKVRGGAEWLENCGACKKRSNCKCCAVYAYLETGRYSAPIPYLCAVAGEAQQFEAWWQKKHRRYFQIAGITARIESDLDFDRLKFSNELDSFAVNGPGEDNVTLRHYFELPDLEGKDLGKEFYRKAPWAISRTKDGTWFYQGISPSEGDDDLHRVAVFSSDHVHGTIYSPPSEQERILDRGWQSLSLFPTDQIWFAPLLADRQAVLVHSGAAIVNGRGLVFVGHSEAGKSTTMELLKTANREGRISAEILCDDRNVIRFWPDAEEKPEALYRSNASNRKSRGQWRIHGTWSHGTTADVSPSSAPLAAILFLKQAWDNRIEPLQDRKIIWHHLLATLIKPMTTAEWWQKELDVLQRIVEEVPCYTLHFDKSGTIVEELAKMRQAGGVD